MKLSLSTLKSLTLALLLAVGVSYASAAWTAAPASPPSCTDLSIPGCNPPINVSTTAQSKAGGLDVANTLSAINGIFTGKVGIGTLSPTQKLDVAGTVKATGLQITTGAGANKVLTSDASGNGTWQDATGGSTSYGSLPGNPRYAALTDAVLVSYLSVGRRAGSDGVGNADTVRNYSIVPTNNILTTGKQYAYILVTSGDSTGQRALSDGTLISSKCYNSGGDPADANPPFIFEDMNGTTRGNMVVSHQGVFTYNPTTIKSADGKTASGVLIAKNTINCSDPGKGNARVYVYETATLQSIMNAMYNETPVSVSYNTSNGTMTYNYSPLNSAYLYHYQP